MGLTYPMRKMTVMLLETGRTANPTVQTLGRLLRACGALWGEVTDLLDSRELVEIDLKPIKDSEFDVRDKRRLEWAVEKQVRKFEAKLAAPVGGKPLHPGKQAETVRKLRNYRMVVSIIEQVVNELLKNKSLSTIEYPAFKAVAREALGVLWREARRRQKSKVKGQNRLEERECRMQDAECKVQNEGSQNSKVKGQSSGESEKLRAKSKVPRAKTKEVRSQKAEGRRTRKGNADCRMQSAECRMAESWTSWRRRSSIGRCRR
jgi:superfamily II DNA or RNA helicase